MNANDEHAHDTTPAPPSPLQSKLDASRKKLEQSRNALVVAPEKAQAAPARRPDKSVAKSQTAKPVDVQDTPPHSNESEQAVLSTLLQYPEVCVPEAKRALTPQHFFNPVNGELFDIIVALFDEGKTDALGLIAFTELLRDRKRLDSLGGPAYVTDLATSGIPAAALPWYAQTLREKLALRELIAVGSKLVRESHGAQDDEVSEILDEAESHITSIRARYSPNSATQDDESEQFESPQPFPLHALPPQIKEMAEAVCEMTRVPPILPGCCGLGMLSGSVGAGVQIFSAANRLTRANLLILASAQSGAGKSDTVRHFSEPFYKFERERLKTWRAQTWPRLLGEQQILEVQIAKLKKEAAENGAPDSLREQLQEKISELQDVQQQLREPLLSCEDVTNEKLAMLLSDNGEQLMSLSADALSIVNILLGRYNKLDRTDESLYLKAYSGDPCRVDRVSRKSIVLESPCLAALWLTQPDKLDALLDERSLHEGGLIPRILACHTNCEPQEINGNATEIPTDVAESYADLIWDLITNYRLAKAPTCVRPTPEATQALNDHFNAIVVRRRNELRDVTSFAARWNESAWRISTCFHAALHPVEAGNYAFDVDTAQRAITIADWFAVEQLRILAARRYQHKVERFEKLKTLIVQDYRGQTPTLRTLQRQNGFEPDEIRDLAAAFSRQLLIHKPKTGERGRPSEIVRLIKA